METIVIGTISKPQGIKGELKIAPLTDNFDRFKNLKSVLIDSKSYTVQSVRVGSDAIYMFIDTVDDRDKAESFRGKNIQVPRVDAVKLPKDKYFIVDVVGSKLFVEDKCVGVVKDILQHSRTDIYVAIGEDKKTFMFPSIARIVVSVDVKEKKIVLNKDGFEDLVVYED